MRNRLSGGFQRVTTVLRREWSRPLAGLGATDGRERRSNSKITIHFAHCRLFLRMDLAANLEAVQKRIAAACGRAGRDPASVTLLAVTKGQPPEIVGEAARLGLTLFGENKVQEAKAKIPLCPGRLRWQMIGHLQSNKCRDAVGLFEMIQSVDSLHLAEEIARRAEQAAKRMPILLEVNAAGEAS